jgi:hypothetical protein
MGKVPFMRFYRSRENKTFHVLGIQDFIMKTFIDGKISLQRGKRTLICIPLKDYYIP